MSKVVCITGMHRSGTSLVASWLQKCGVQMDNGELIGASIGNKKGHFEDKEFVDLHSKTIEEQYEKSKGWIVWQDPINLKLPILTVKEIVKVREENYYLWGWKDPRSVLFLEEWKKIIPDLKFVFIWRNASEVVNSLLNRSKSSKHPTDSISKWNAYRTWYNYNCLIKKFNNRYPEDCIVFSLDYLISNDKEIFERISQKFEMKIDYYPLSNITERNMFSDKKIRISDMIFQYAIHTEELEKSLKSLKLK